MLLTLSPSLKKGKAYTATGTYEGKKIVIHGGILSDDELSKVSKERYDNYILRFGVPKTVKQYLNQLRWEGAKIGDTVDVPDFLLL